MFYAADFFLYHKLQTSVICTSQIFQSSVKHVAGLLYVFHYLALYYLIVLARFADLPVFRNSSSMCLLSVDR